MRPIPNSIVRGEVVRLTGEEVWIEVSNNSRAAVPLQEFYDEALCAILPPRLGQHVAVLIEAVDQKTGAIILSYRKAKRHRSPGEDLAWRRITEGHVKPGDVVAAVRHKRGRVLLVTFTFQVGSSVYYQDAVLPTRELQWPEHAEYYVGQTVKCQILDIDTVVVSERKLIERRI